MKLTNTMDTNFSCDTCEIADTCKADDGNLCIKSINDEETNNLPVEPDIQG